MRQEIAPDHDVAALLGRTRIRLDASHAVPDVGGIRRLAHLAVADDRDNRRELERDLVYAVRRRGSQLRRDRRLCRVCGAWLLARLLCCGDLAASRGKSCVAAPRPTLILGP